MLNRLAAWVQLCLSRTWTGLAAHTEKEQTHRLGAVVVYDLESRRRRHFEAAKSVERHKPGVKHGSRFRVHATGDVVAVRRTRSRLGD